MKGSSLIAYASIAIIAYVIWKSRQVERAANQEITRVPRHIMPRTFMFTH